jgi:tetratricopeptide (TPR) repeat protein
MTKLDNVITEGWAKARRDNAELTVIYFRDLLTRHPNTREALFAYASALDYAGHDADAALAYEQAFAVGVDGDDLRRGLLQYGSILRKLERFDEAVAALEKADEQFPGHDSVKVFPGAVPQQCRTQPRSCRPDRINSDDLQRYQWALRQYTADLTK